VRSDLSGRVAEAGEVDHARKPHAVEHTGKSRCGASPPPQLGR
jgi:hypothetical protein